MNELESINEEIDDITSVLLGQYCVSYAKTSEYLEDAVHALDRLDAEHCGLKERFKEKEKEWIKNIQEHEEKCNLEGENSSKDEVSSHSSISLTEQTSASKSPHFT